jgi:integrase
MEPLGWHEQVSVVDEQVYGGAPERGLHLAEGMFKVAGRRTHGEDSISFDHRGPCIDPERHRRCPGRWRGQVSLGFGPDGKRIRKKVVAATKTDLVAKLKELHDDLDTGVTDRAATLKQSIDDWLAEGRDGRSPKTIRRDRSLFYSSLAPDQLRAEFAAIGRIKLRELNASHIRQALVTVAKTRSTATVSLIHNCLTRAIRHAEARDLVRRNVATLVDTPKGQDGRPSKSLTLEQALAVIKTAKALPQVELHPGLKDVRRAAELMYAYIVLSVLVGLRTEEARALLWDNVHLDSDQPHVEVWRSVRERGETKTRKSRRTVGLPRFAVEALRAWRKAQAAEQLAAGPRWDSTGLVFTSGTGTALDDGNVRKMFKRICREAGIGDNWSPRELRHTFVSIMSDQNVPVEKIADLVGHAGGSRVTETVYRHILKPVIADGAEVMDRVFGG